MTGRLPPDELRAAVLDACRRSIAAGLVPSGLRLRGSIPGYSETTLCAHRRALRDAGVIDWSHLDGRDYSPGLPCRTEADLAVIRERARLVRRGIDPDTGMAPPSQPLQQPSEEM